MGKWADRLRGLTLPLRLLRRMPGWMRWFTLAAFALLVIWLFVPVASLVSGVISLMLGLLEPLLASTVGRVLFTIGILAAAIALLGWAFRPRWQRLRHEAALGRYLRAHEALLCGHERRGNRLLRSVGREPAAPADQGPDLRHLAKLDQAQHALERQRPERTLELLGKVDLEGADPSLRARWAKLHAAALLRQGEVLPGAVAEELRAALREAPGRPSLLEDLARAHRRAGDLVAAARALEERVDAVASHARKNAADEAHEAWDAALSEALDEGRTEEVEVLLRERGPGAHPLVEGDLAASRGDFPEAIGHWHRAGTADGLRRLAALLRARPGLLDVDELLRRFPAQGTLLVAAAEFRRNGESDKAERAARHAWKGLRGNATAAASIADVLLDGGHGEDAEAVLREGIAAVVATHQASPEPSRMGARIPSA